MSESLPTDLVDQTQVVCEAVRSSLGPFGATKMIVEENGAVSTTSSGSLVLERIDVDGPLVDVLKTMLDDFRAKYGDGTTSLVTLTGALLREADALMEIGVHPTTVVQGYQSALTRAIESTQARALSMNAVGGSAVAASALTSVRDPMIRDRTAEQLLQAVEKVSEDGTFDADWLSVITRLGAAKSETDLVHGTVLDECPVTDDMPRTAEDAAVALLSTTVDVPALDQVVGSGTVSLEAAGLGDLRDLAETEREAFDASLDPACDVIATTDAVNDRVKRILSNRGVLALQRLSEADMRKLSRATGGSIVPRLQDIDQETTGMATVRVRRHAGRDMTIVETAGDAPVYTLFCRAPDPRSSDEFERSVEAAIAAIDLTRRCGSVVPGGGAVEMNASQAVKEYSRTVASREQLAIEAFGNALTTIPRTLAENAGKDGRREIMRLRVAHAEGRKTAGVLADVDGAADVIEHGPVVEPLRLRTAIWTTATSIVSQVLRVDDVLATDTGSYEKTDAPVESST